MGIEGHESPRDVASEEKKHPWDVFPDGETSAEDGGKKREKTEKKLKLPKNKFALVGIFVFVVLIGVGIFFGIRFLVENKSGNGGNGDGQQAEIISSISGDATIENAATHDLAYTIALKNLSEAMYVGANVNGYTDYAIVKDNIDAFLDRITKEDERDLYLAITVVSTSAFEDNKIAELYFEKLEELDYNDLGETQKYAYILAYINYYRYAKEDEEKANEYVEMLDKEFSEDDEVYIESGTNNVINQPEEDK